MTMFREEREVEEGLQLLQASGILEHRDFEVRQELLSKGHIV